MTCNLRKRSPSTILFILLFTSLLRATDINQPHEIKSYIPGNISIDNQNWNITQNPKNGLVYFANSDGLVEYNGISKKTYHLPYRKGVRSVLADKKGDIFTGSFEDFGVWNLTSSGQLTYRSLTKEIKIGKNDEIWKIYSSAGKIYFQSFTTIYVYDYKRVVSIKSPFTMLFLFQVGNHFIAQVLDHGLYWFDGKKFEFIPGSQLYAFRKVHSIIEGKGNEIYICTSNSGIYKYTNNQFTYFSSPISSFLQDYTCNAGVSINDSIMAFGTIQNGVVFCNRQGEILKHYNFSNGLKNNTVLSLSKDMDNGLWVGLDEGVNYVDVFSPYTHYTNTTGTLGTIYTVLKDKNQLYLGTNHGLFVADIFKDNFNYNFTNIRMIPNSQGQVWTLEKFDDQILCGHNEGTFIVEGNQFRQISNVTGGWSIRQYHDMLIEGTYTGIVVFKKNEKGKWVFRNKVKDFNEPVRHLEVDYLGFIWAPHLHKGIYKLELDESLDSIVKSDYYNIVLDKPFQTSAFKINNNVAFSTTENIYTYDYEKKKVVVFNSLNASLGEFIHTQQIILHEKDEYWFVNDRKIGLFQISKDFVAKKKFEFSQKSIDLPERENQIIQLDDKTLLIPTRQVFLTYNLTYREKNPEKVKLRINNMVFQGKGKVNEFCLEQSNTIQSAYRNNNLTVYFIDPEKFSQEDKVFFYKIKEIDEGWHKTTLDYFSYLNLKYGTYHLLVKSDINDEGAEVKFTILRPWYLDWYAFLLYSLVLIGIVLLAIYIFRIELRRQKKLIEFEVGRKKLESELDYKSYELMLSMRYLIQKNEILSELQEQISSLKESSSKYPIKSIRDIERIINEGLKTQTEEWTSAMDTLKLSQQGFFKMLKAKHPKLTPHDLRLCSYLRMNFTTKEIAKLLNINPRGVEISRYRLRLKMGLSHEVNLTEYLISEAFEE